jgi:nucleoside-diphosphate-sugar epimerase
MNLVTGASGFIGTRLVARLRAEGCRLRLVSRRPVAGDPSWVSCDLRERDCWPALLDGVTLVFHLAGQTSVRTAELDPVADARINTDAMLGLLAAAQHLGTRPTVVFASTETIAGVHRDRLDDDVPDAPVTRYDAHKLAAERALREAVSAGIVRGGSLRLTTVYGPGPRPQASERGIVDLMLARALAGQALTVYGDGQQLRDLLYIDDAVAALLAAAAVPDQLDGDHFVVGSGAGLTIVELFERIAKLVERELEIRAPVIHVQPPEPRSIIDERSVIADPSRFCARTGWTPTIDFDEGLRRTLANKLR